MKGTTHSINIVTALHSLYLLMLYGIFSDIAQYISCTLYTVSKYNVNYDSSQQLYMFVKGHKCKQSKMYTCSENCSRAMP